MSHDSYLVLLIIIAEVKPSPKPAVTGKAKKEQKQISPEQNLQSHPLHSALVQFFKELLVM